MNGDEKRDEAVGSAIEDNANEDSAMGTAVDAAVDDAAGDAVASSVHAPSASFTAAAAVAAGKDVADGHIPDSADKQSVDDELRPLEDMVREKRDDALFHLDAWAADQEVAGAKQEMQALKQEVERERDVVEALERDRSSVAAAAAVVEHALNQEGDAAARTQQKIRLALAATSQGLSSEAVQGSFRQLEAQ